MNGGGKDSAMVARMDRLGDNFGERLKDLAYDIFVKEKTGGQPSNNSVAPSEPVVSWGLKNAQRPLHLPGGRPWHLG